MGQGGVAWCIESLCSPCPCHTEAGYSLLVVVGDNCFQMGMPPAFNDLHIVQGSSAPINIPMLARQRFAGFKEDEDEQHTGIIPPHLLAAQVSF